MSDNGAAPETAPAEAVPEVKDAIAAVLAPKEAAPETKEAPKVEAKEDPKKEDSKLASKFAALSKRDKQIAAREKALEAREKALKEATAKPADKEPEKAPLKLRMNQDPFATLKEEFGIDLETLTAIAKNQGKLTPEMELKLKVEQGESSLREELEALKKSIKEKDEAEKSTKQQEAEQKAFQDFKGSIAEHIKAAPADYELLGLEDDPAQTVYDVISAHYEATKGDDGVGRILSTKEAADHIENHLLEEAKKYTGLSKIKGLFAPKEAPKVDVAATQKVDPKTLSNELTGQTPPAQKKVLTREEELAEAVKLMRFAE